MSVTDDQIVKKYQSIQNRCLEKGLDFNLSLVSIRNLLNAKKCYYTGTKFGRGQTALSIDRVDSSKGYVKGNVVACTVRANGLKSNMTKSEICKMAKMLEKRKGN